VKRRDSGWLALAAMALAASGCGDVCEYAAQICADEGRVATPDEGDEESVECTGKLERHATCIEEAGTCEPKVVARCWKAAGE
jgi:hypothetical protein